MHEYEDFDKDLAKAPKNADAFMIVLPYKRGVTMTVDKKDQVVDWYDSSQYKFRDEDTEGRITKADVDGFLTKLYEEIRPREISTSQKVIDNIVIFLLLIGIICLFFGLSIFGPRGAGLYILIISLGLAIGSLAYLIWIYKKRTKLGQDRISKLKEVLEKQQDTVFSQKGAVVCMSELESYITIELVYKYARIARYAKPEDKDKPPRISSLKDFNQDMFDQITEQETTNDSPTISYHDVTLLRKIREFSELPRKESKDLKNQKEKTAIRNSSNKTQTEGNTGMERVSDKNCELHQSLLIEDISGEKQSPSSLQDIKMDTNPILSYPVKPDAQNPSPGASKITPRFPGRDSSLSHHGSSPGISPDSFEMVSPESNN